MFPLIRDQGADSAFLYAGRAGRWDSGWRTIGIYILGIPSSYQIYYLRSSSCSLCCCLIAKSCPTLCDPMDCSPPGSSVHGISQARILESVVISYSKGSSQSRDQTQSGLDTEPPGKPLYYLLQVTKSFSLFSITYK